MARPLVPWNAENFRHQDIIWWTQVDSRFLAEVRRTGGYTANLLLFEHEKDDTEIACLGVGLSYGARFGPDMADIELWQTIVIDFINNYYNKH